MNEYPHISKTISSLPSAFTSKQCEILRKLLKSGTLFIRLPPMSAARGVKHWGPSPLYDMKNEFCVFFLLRSSSRATTSQLILVPSYCWLNPAPMLQIALLILVFGRLDVTSRLRSKSDLEHASHGSDAGYSSSLCLRDVDYSCLISLSIRSMPKPL